MNSQQQIYAEATEQEIWCFYHQEASASGNVHHFSFRDDGTGCDVAERASDYTQEHCTTEEGIDTTVGFSVLLYTQYLKQAYSDTVRQIMFDNNPDGADIRFPGNKKPIQRGRLTGTGIMEEIHADGHEKLNRKALQMGSVGMDIYAFRDHTGKILMVQ
jgi:hypothetical protein